MMCSQKVFGRNWRARSPGNIVDEIQWLVNDIGVKEISIEDDNFTFDIERAFEICDLIRKRDIRVVWQLANGIRVDKINKRLLKQTKGFWGQRKNVFRRAKEKEFRLLRPPNHWRLVPIFLCLQYFSF